MSHLVLTADDAVPASSDVDDAVADVAARVNALYAAEALDDDVAWRVSVEDSIELDLSRDTLTYGEISVSGLARALRAALDLAGPEGTRGQEVFYDLGCGRGVAARSRPPRSPSTRCLAARSRGVSESSCCHRSSSAADGRNRGARGWQARCSSRRASRRGPTNTAARSFACRARATPRRLS